MSEPNWKHDILPLVTDECLQCIEKVDLVGQSNFIGKQAYNRTINCIFHDNFNHEIEEANKWTCGNFSITQSYYKKCLTPHQQSNLTVFENMVRCANDEVCATDCVRTFLNDESNRQFTCNRATFRERYCIDYGVIHASGYRANGCSLRHQHQIVDTFANRMKALCGVTEPSSDTNIMQPNYILWILPPTVVVTVLICIVVLGLAWRRHRRIKRRSGRKAAAELGLGLDDMRPSSYEQNIQDLVNRRGINPSLLGLDERLGQGHFGVVRKANLYTNTEKTSCITVAAKLLKNTQPLRKDIEAFLHEAVFMVDLTHPNILHLIGVVWENNSLPILILPYMGKGDLHTVICKNPSFNEADLINFGDQIVSGCLYMEENHVIHRDIALANCLVSDLFVVKIADFGLSRGDHYYCDVHERELRWKWLAPECMSRGSFSHKSDVWAFGLLLWEMFSNGATPHSAMGSLSVLQECLQGGYRMGQPEKMPEYLFDLVQKMWDITPEERPSFGELKAFFKAKIQRMEKDIDYDYTPDEVECLFPGDQIYITFDSEESGYSGQADPDENKAMTQSTSNGPTETVVSSYAINPASESREPSVEYANVVSIATRNEEPEAPAPNIHNDDYLIPRHSSSVE